ncbi:MAG: hypothetical protein L0229_16940, partial [Blastocatellia bacterium]|nr:hypothetical protein [Blastocatellia bacterium]
MLCSAESADPLLELFTKTFAPPDYSRRVGPLNKALAILRAGQNENFSREERLCGVRRPFSFFRDFFLL